MRSYIVGRDPSPSQPRIVVADKSVSRTHAVLSLLDGGSFVLEDLNSSNGTFVRERGGWRRIGTANLNIADEVRLGVYSTTVSELLQAAIGVPGRARVERNPETGEIIKQRGGR